MYTNARCTLRQVWLTGPCSGLVTRLDYNLVATFKDMETFSCFFLQIVSVAEGTQALKAKVNIHSNILPTGVDLI